MWGSSSSLGVLLPQTMTEIAPKMVESALGVSGLFWLFWLFCAETDVMNLQFTKEHSLPEIKTIMKN